MTQTREKDELIKAAHYGDPEAQFSVGINFKNGAFGHPMDVDQALEWLIKAARGGHPKALGVLFGLDLPRMRALQREFEGKERVKADGRNAMVKAACEGDPTSQVRLGWRLWFGSGGFTQDRTGALKWIELACREAVLPEPERAFEVGYELWQENEEPKGLGAFGLDLITRAAHQGITLAIEFLAQITYLDRDLSLAQVLVRLKEVEAWGPEGFQFNQFSMLGRTVRGDFERRGQEIAALPPTDLLWFATRNQNLARLEVVRRHLIAKEILDGRSEGLAWWWMPVFGMAPVLQAEERPDFYEPWCIHLALLDYQSAEHWISRQ